MGMTIGMTTTTIMDPNMDRPKGPQTVRFPVLP